MNRDNGEALARQSYPAEARITLFFGLEGAVDVQAIRDQIPITRSINYLNTGWTSPALNSVIEAIQGQLHFESEEGAATLAGLERSEEAVVKLRKTLATFFNASFEELMPTNNTTAGLNMIVGGMDWREGDGLITCTLEHPSVLGIAHGLQNRFGAKLGIVQISPEDDAATILEKFDGAIDSDTRLIAISHVQYSCGLRMPVEEIITLAHDRGAHVLLDGAQAAGHLDIDFSELGVDYYAMPGQKWLLGPSGTGLLYVREELIPELQPFAGSYRSVASWEADGAVTFKERELEKLLAGTASTALQCGQEAGVNVLAGIGMAHVERRHLTLGYLLKQRLSRISGVNLLSPVEELLSSGLVTCAVDGIRPDDLVERLYRNYGVAVRAVVHPPGIRLCTAFFNTEDEIEGAADAIERVLKMLRP